MNSTSSNDFMSISPVIASCLAFTFKLFPSVFKFYPMQFPVYVSLSYKFRLFNLQRSGIFKF